MDRWDGAPGPLCIPAAGSVAGFLELPPGKRHSSPRVTAPPWGNYEGVKGCLPPLSQPGQVGSAVPGPECLWGLQGLPSAPNPRSLPGGRPQEGVTVNLHGDLCHRRLLGAQPATGAFFACVSLMLHRLPSPAVTSAAETGSVGSTE